MSWEIPTGGGDFGPAFNDNHQTTVTNSDVNDNNYGNDGYVASYGGGMGSGGGYGGGGNDGACFNCGEQGYVRFPTSIIHGNNV